MNRRLIRKTRRLLRRYKVPKPWFIKALISNNIQSWDISTNNEIDITEGPK